VCVCVCVCVWGGGGGVGVGVEGGNWGGVLSLIETGISGGIGRA